MPTLEKRVQAIERGHSELRKMIELPPIASGALVDKTTLEKLSENQETAKRGDTALLAITRSRNASGRIDENTPARPSLTYAIRLSDLMQANTLRLLDVSREIISSRGRLLSGKKCYVNGQVTSVPLHCALTLRITAVQISPLSNGSNKMV